MCLSCNADSKGSDQTISVDSRYLEFQGTLLNTSRYPYLDISDLQYWRKSESNDHISQMNM